MPAERHHNNPEYENAYLVLLIAVLGQAADKFCA